MDTHTPSVGEEVEAACWFIPAKMGDKDNAKSIVRAALRDYEEESRVTLSPTSWAEFKVEENDRIPPPPENLWGAEPRLLLGTSRIVIVHHRVSELLVDPEAAARYLASLTDEQLAERRAWTREVAKQYGRTLTDQECDALIVQHGPKSEERSIRKVMVQVQKP